MGKSRNLKRIALRVEKLSIKRESMLAEARGKRKFIIRSIPAFTYGIAYGDEIEILNDEAGEFRVINRSGHVTVRVFLPGGLDKKSIDQLIEAVSILGGLHEIGKNAISEDGLSMLLLSIPVSIGFPKIERLMRDLETIKARWEYGNVYTDDGTALNWW
jgi:hypothetical protein